MFKLSISHVKSQDKLKARPLVLNSEPDCDYKGKVFEVNGATSVDTWMARKQTALLLIWRKFQGLIQRKVPILFSSVKAERAKKDAGKKK